MDLKINGKAVTFDGDPDQPLLWVLRDEVGLAVSVELPLVMYQIDGTGASLSVGAQDVTVQGDFTTAADGVLIMQAPGGIVRVDGVPLAQLDLRKWRHPEWNRQRCHNVCVNVEMNP